MERAFSYVLYCCHGIFCLNGQLCPQQDSQEKDANPVKSEEAKLKSKYPNLGQKPGGSDFLMKRLQKGVRDCPSVRYYHT